MVDVNEDYISKLLEVVNQSPFPQHLGMQLAAIQLDAATVTLDIQRCHMQPFGMVHGGVLSTLIDTATFWAVFLRLPEDAGLVNIDLKLNYLKPATTGFLTSGGRCIWAGSSISYAEAAVKDADGGLLAHGTSTLMVLPGKGIKIGVHKFSE